MSSSTLGRGVMIKIDATLNLAQSMCESVKDPDEVERRNIVGRLYYGVFHIARDATGATLSRAGGHQAVIEHYKSIDNGLSNRLDWLRQLRNRADYDLNSTVTLQEMKSARNQSEYIRQALAQS